MTTSNEDYFVFVGTYTRTTSKGIYTYRFNSADGSLAYQSHISGTASPSYLAIHPSRRFLYAVSEVADFRGETSGGVAAFAIDPATGSLTQLNDQPTIGTGPCHVTVDATGKFVAVANYQSGSFALFPLEDDGRLGEASDFHQHEGSSVNTERQQGPHGHSINFDPPNRFAFAADLGIDKVLIYRLDTAAGRLAPHEVPFASVAPGSGPRHFDFHPNGQFAYLINEIGCTVTAFAYDANRGALSEIHTVGTLPEGFEGRNTTADVHVHPSGKYLYGSNRGHNSLAIFGVNEANGRLTPAGHQSTGGKTPRNFAIDPTGKYLLAANQDTDNVVTFRIDGETGQLTPTGEETEIPIPVCLKFMAVGG